MFKYRKVDSILFDLLYSNCILVLLIFTCKISLSKSAVSVIDFKVDDKNCQFIRTLSVNSSICDCWTEFKLFAGVINGDIPDDEKYEISDFCKDQLVKVKEGNLPGYSFCCGCNGKPLGFISALGPVQDYNGDGRQSQSSSRASSRGVGK